MITNHWGIWVDSEIAVTGVISNHTPEFLWDESFNSIDSDFEEFIKLLDSDLESGNITEDEFNIISEGYESMPDSTLLIGDWIKDNDGLYEPDPKGEYSAIMGESVTQIVLSKYTRRGALCSPCYPGQVDLDSFGAYLAFDLPPELYGENKIYLES